ncbi:MAG TPA: ABC transporter substrate-binding protein [Candidatus Limnocylindria bacterium]|nr:ABC transporter substrate-binding protein [Candidatus Limnocylindria bacterium]
MVLGLVLAACQSGSTQSADPSGSAAATEEESRAPFVASSYPTDGPADCAYGGEFSQIKAVDELTVEFTLCYPDPAFLSKISFIANGIQDSDYLEANMVNHLILAKPNGTGPYKFNQYVRGDHVSLVANDSYWGEKAFAQELQFQWNSEAAARLLALQSGTVDGIDNPGPDDFGTIEGNADLTLYNREALNTMYVGWTNTFAPFDDPKVRQALAQGIDRQRIVDNFYPGGSTVASHFTPCNIDLGCEGDPWYEYDKDAANALLDEAFGAGQRFSTKIYYRDVVRGYLPDPNVVAQELQKQLQDNLGITAEIEVQESGTFLDNSSAGLLDGLYLLGWGADYPDPTNFLDYHFNNPGNLQFGTIDASVTEPLDTGAQTLDHDARQAAYVEANNAIRAFVPMIPIAHGASAAAFKADVTGAHASPLTSELFSVMDPGGRDILVFMQNAYPISLYCADETDGETLRICEQMTESLYAYETGGTEPVPSLATSCEANAEATVWTCTLRDGVKFHDGASLDASDVVDSYAVQWDLDHPLHIGRTGAFEYFAGFFGQYLNVPPPASAAP